MITGRIRLLTYLVAYPLLLPLGVSHIIALIAATDIVCSRSPARGGQSDPRLWWACVTDAQPSSWWTILAMLLLPLVVFKLSAVAAFPIDRWFTVPAAGGQISLFPGVWLLILYAVPLFWLLRHARRPGVYGPRCSAAAIAVLVAVAVLSVVVSRAATFQGWLASHGGLTATSCLALGVKSFYYNGLWEELYYRGMLLRLLLSRIGPRGAIIGSATVFTVYHVDLISSLFTGGPPTAMLNLASIFILGLACGYVLVRSQSLLPCIVFHGCTSGAGYLMAYFLKVHSIAA